MGSSNSTSKRQTPLPIDSNDQHFNQRCLRWKEAARTKENKVEAALVEIKKIRSEMQNKNKSIGESRLSTLRDVEREKAELLIRLSNLASDRMRNQNAKIADLSDTNRPTKLAERLSELYDNEWTDAFTELSEKDNHDEQTAITTLLSMLKNCYQSCLKIALKQQKEIEKNFIKDYERTNKSYELRITECQKLMAEITYKDLQQNCDNLVQEDKEKNKECLKFECVNKYYKLCIELTWLMCIQAPPVKLEFDPKKDTVANWFRHYTRLGDEIDFVVWPVIFLHEKGPILSKGVIQFKTSKKSNQISANVNKKGKTKNTSSEAKSEIKSDNASLKTRTETTNATETIVIENHSEAKRDMGNDSNTSKPENLKF